MKYWHRGKKRGTVRVWYWKQWSWRSLRFYWHRYDWVFSKPWGQPRCGRCDYSLRVGPFEIVRKKGGMSEDHRRRREGA